MMVKRAAALLFAVTCIVLVGIATAARCYPPNTRVVVFIQGLYTTYDAGGTQPNGVEAHRFDTLRAALTAKGYPAERLVDYSYAGGSVGVGGRWVPRPYNCELTDRPAATSLTVLEDMLRSYRAAHPKAHFTLVGHSLGGYLAFLEGAREAGRPDDQRLDIDGVVTLDAPLEGVSADKKVVIDVVPCEKSYVAGAEIVADKADAGTPARRESEAAAMAAAGIRLATLGNVDDCLYNTAHCVAGGWADDSGTQVVDGAALSRMYAIDIQALLSHDVINGSAQVAADVVEFVGAP